MIIKIEMEIKGERIPMEPWLLKHVEAIAKEYSERVLSGKSKLPGEIETIEVEDEDSYLDDEEEDEEEED